MHFSFTQSNMHFSKKKSSWCVLVCVCVSVCFLCTHKVNRTPLSISIHCLKIVEIPCSCLPNKYVLNTNTHAYTSARSYNRGKSCGYIWFSFHAHKCICLSFDLYVCMCVCVAAMCVCVCVKWWCVDSVGRSTKKIYLVYRVVGMTSCTAYAWRMSLYQSNVVRTHDKTRVVILTHKNVNKIFFVVIISLSSLLFCLCLDRKKFQTFFTFIS